MKMVSSVFERTPPLFLNLSKMLAGEISCSSSDLEKYSTDDSPYSITPQAVIYPKNITDIRHTLSFAREYSMPVTVRGCGSAKLGGCLSEGIILDMTRYLNSVRHISMVDNVVTVDAGMTVSELASRLDGWGFELPPLLRSESTTSIGALFSTRSVSPSTFFHGSIREWVEAVTVVVDNGEEHKIADGITPSGRLLGIYQAIFPILSEHGAKIRAAKPQSSEDSTGYSIWNTSIGPRQLIDQLSGSEGTLGIVTSITFRLIPKREHSEVCVLPITTEDIASIIEVAKETRADSIFLYDETFQNLCEKYHPGLLPTFVGSPYTLIVIHKDTDSERLRDSVKYFVQELPIPNNNIERSNDEKRFLRVMSQEFLHSLFEMYGKGALIPLASTEGGIVKINEVTKFIADIEEYTEREGVVGTITGCIGSGHVAVTTLLDPYSRLYLNDISRHQEAIFSLIKKYKGGISALGGDGLSRTPYLSYCYDEATISLFENIKKAWDPLLVLNPSKKTAVSLNYLSQHLYKPKQITDRD